MNISNALTLSRLAGIPVLMALLLVRFPGHDQVAAALFIAFSLTDTLDGQLARRRGTVSDFGKFMDPLADKLFVLAVLLVLVQAGLVAAWVVVVIFSRELIITILRSVGAGQGRVIAAAPLGKTKTVTQMAAVTLLILQRPYPALIPLATIGVGIAVVFTLWSGLDYLWRFRYLIGPFDTSRMRAGPSGGAPDASPAKELGDVLGESGLTVSVAESSTGGMIGSLITDQPGEARHLPRGQRHGDRGSGRRRIEEGDRAHLHRGGVGGAHVVARVPLRGRPLFQPQAGGGRGVEDARRRGTQRGRDSGQERLTLEHLFATLARTSAC
jgi:CDP-diacylglycerol--glycerol-3-phosphate 3-phosphatidyltransferase